MKKYITLGLLSVLLSPALAFATSYDTGMIKMFLMVSIFDEIILFAILPILIIFLIVRITKYRKTSLEDPLKEKRKSKIHKTILAIFIFLVLGIILPKEPGSEPCGVNMMSSCPVSFYEVLSRYGIVNHKIKDKGLACPPGQKSTPYDGRIVCE